MLIGYARVSKSNGQDTAAQLCALRDIGCERILEENASGGCRDRPQLHRLLEELRPGDVVVVWELGRLSLSLSDLLRTIESIEAAGAGLRSLKEAIDTTTLTGKMMIQMLDNFAYSGTIFRQFEFFDT